MESTESRFGVRNRRWTLMNRESCPNLNSIITAAKLESVLKSKSQKIYDLWYPWISNI